MVVNVQEDLLKINCEIFLHCLPGADIEKGRKQISLVMLSEKSQAHNATCDLIPFIENI